MKAQFIQLKECADVLPGLSIKTKLEHDPHGSHWLILPRHVSPGGALNYAPDEVSIDEDMRVSPGVSASNYLIKPGDVLIIARGTNNLPIYVEEVPETTVAANMFLIVRPKKSMIGKYLAWCLAQKSSQAALAQTRTIGVTPMIQRSEFEQLVIPVPNLDVQTKLATLFELMQREKALLDKLVAEKVKRHDQVGEKLLQMMQKEE